MNTQMHLIGILSIINVHFHEVNVPKYPLFHYQPYELALSSKIVDMVKMHNIDVLHVHYAIPHAYARSYCYACKGQKLDRQYQKWGCC